MPTPDPQEMLARLLGPNGPELSCEACFEELDRYVELQLSGEPCGDLVPGMRAHLAGCPACREEHASLRAVVGRDEPDA